MDIMNQLPQDKFHAVDDLLAFISIYDDRARTNAYFHMLQQEQGSIKGAVCVDAGAGIGIFSERMIQLGARRVYAVEPNPYLFQILTKRLQPYPNAILVNSPIEKFVPPESVDILVHEFFGQLLYDEDLYALEKISFQPGKYLPDGAVLKYGLTSITPLADETVTPEVFHMLEGVLVSGLFDEADLDLPHSVIEWHPGAYARSAKITLPQEGDVLYLGLVILHQNKEICRAGHCTNWAFVWTPVVGSQFEIRFLETERGSDVYFTWLK